MGPMAPLEATSRENIDRQFRTNVLGVLYTAKAVIPHFRSRHTGMIINVGSMVGKLLCPLVPCTTHQNLPLKDFRGTEL